MDKPKTSTPPAASKVAKPMKQGSITSFFRTPSDPTRTKPPQERLQVTPKAKPRFADKMRTRESSAIVMPADALGDTQIGEGTTAPVVERRPRKRPIALLDSDNDDDAPGSRTGEPEPSSTTSSTPRAAAKGVAQTLDPAVTMPSVTPGAEASSSGEAPSLGAGRRASRDEAKNWDANDAVINPAALDAASPKLGPLMEQGSGVEGDTDADVEEEKDQLSGHIGKAVPDDMVVSSLSTAPTWQKGKSVPYNYLAEAFARVEAITGRLEIQAILTDVFRNVIGTTPLDLVPVIYLCVNKLAPAHDGVEIGVGEGILMKALCQTMGLSMASLKSKYREAGDLGDVAFGARATQKTMFPPPPLTVRKVFDELHLIAESSGKAAQETKRSKIMKLLVASQTRNEAKFITRALLGKLRIHLADKTVVIALANAVTLAKLGAETSVLLGTEGKKKTKLSKSEERIEEKLKDAGMRLSSVYNQLPVWEIIVPALLKCGDIHDFAEECKFKPGIPVAPMLAKPTNAITEVLERFSEFAFTCEYKYDGERAQVHRLADGTVKIYSRNAENLTPKYPEIVRVISTTLKDEWKDASFVLDAETVAYDVEKKKILPFQELQSRKRKDVSESSVSVRVCLFAFDLLFFDGRSLLLDPLSKRRQVMMDSFSAVEGTFMFAQGHDSRDPEEIMELLNESVKAGCEGLMVKALEGPNATYEPANRSQNWLKVKKDYLEGLGDTLDLVPVGGYVGRGRRTGTYGGFLLACYDPENEEYQTVCKIGTGFTDEDLEKLSAFYNDKDAERLIDGPKSYYRFSGNKGIEPDVWFEPCQVWEVKCADLSISPAHTAAIGKVDANKGIALRFPRFLRLREDKGPDDATTSDQVSELYSKQSSIAHNIE
jgi:DNA ligase 1